MDIRKDDCEENKRMKLDQDPAEWRAPVSVALNFCAVTSES
jgi:hypothetical protein